MSPGGRAFANQRFTLHTLPRRPTRFGFGPHRTGRSRCIAGRAAHLDLATNTLLSPVLGNFAASEGKEMGPENSYEGGTPAPRS